MYLVELNDLQGLFTELSRQGYTVIGPQVRNGAITFDSLTTVEELPRGWTDTQDGGTYGIERSDDDALFSFTVGPHSWTGRERSCLRTVPSAESQPMDSA